MEIIDYEVHDVGLAIEALTAGFWIDNMLAECRSGEQLKMPYQRATNVRGDGFVWYDTGQEHIVSDLKNQKACHQGRFMLKRCFI